MNGMRRSSTVMIVMVITTCLHFFWCYLFVIIYPLDIVGVSIATFITYTLNFILATLICMYSKDLKSSFFWFTNDSFTEIKEYLAIGIPSAAIICAEWSCYEILIFLSGFLNVLAQSAMSIIVNLFYVFLATVFGFAISAQVCIGNAMGEGNPNKAKTFLTLHMIFGIIFCSIGFCLIYLLRYPLARCFTND